MTKRPLAFLLVVWWLLVSIPLSSAQELLTNMQVLETLGTACLKSVPVEADSLSLSPPVALPYLTTTLIQHWQHQGKILFFSDSLHTLPFQLSWEISGGSISYMRVRRKILARSAELRLRYTLLGRNGEILSQDSCHQSFSDQIPRNVIAQVESALYPETQAELPPQRWIRRHLEPVIIAAATGLAAFLFFNLRNDSAD